MLPAGKTAGTLWGIRVGFNVEVIENKGKKNEL